MAKTGTITAVSGSATAIKSTVAASDPRVSNLGSVVADVLAANTAKSLVCVSTIDRTVTLLPTASNGAVETALTGAGLDVDKITPTTTSRSTPWIVTGVDEGPLKTELDGLVLAKSPSFSIASLVSAIEDAAAGVGKSAIITINQETAEVKVWQGVDADLVDVCDDTITALPGMLAHFKQDVQASSGPKDAFE